jgi:predicted RNase H-like nuclease (RuvC/YqgF family)
VNEAMNEDELRDYIVNLENRVYDLEAEIEELTNSNEILRQENRDFDDTIGELQDEISDFKCERDDREEIEWWIQWHRDMGNISDEIIKDVDRKCHNF